MNPVTPRGQRPAVDVIGRAQHRRALLTRRWPDAIKWNQYTRGGSRMRQAIALAHRRSRLRPARSIPDRKLYLSAATIIGLGGVGDS